MSSRSPHFPTFRFVTAEVEIECQCRVGSMSHLIKSYLSLLFTLLVSRLINHLVFFPTTVPPDISDAESSSDLTINEGQNALLYCTANGHPMPRITWRRDDGSPIILKNNQTDAVRRFETYSGNYLNFYKVDRRQMGAYLCIAANDVPPAVSKRVLLNVHCKIPFLLSFFCFSIQGKKYYDKLFCSLQKKYGREGIFMRNDRIFIISEILLEQWCAVLRELGIPFVSPSLCQKFEDFCLK